nr:hypothetical protein [Tanacetum cinerariifolium]
VAKLLVENEKLHKKIEHLKQTYKDLYDSIKKTRVQTKDHNDSLIAQINSKIIENADLKAQIQEKVFANVALKNELRKLKGNSVDTKFAKPSILGKPVLQPPRNQSVVRQPNMFKSKRPNFLKPRIFKTAGLMWIPTGNMFTDSTTKVDTEPQNGSNKDITNPYECEQTLNVSVGKLTNLKVEERFAFNVSLRMFTRSIVIQRRVEDLQLGVESYQNKLNLTRPDSYHFDLEHKESYIAYSNPRGFIYQNKDKQNRLIRIDKLHKFSDGTLTDVRTALDDRLIRGSDEVFATVNLEEK